MVLVRTGGGSLISMATDSPLSGAIHESCNLGVVSGFSDHRLNGGRYLSLYEQNMASSAGK